MAGRGIRHPDGLAWPHSHFVTTLAARVTAVCPSLTFTDMAAGIKDNKPLLAKFAERIPLGA